MNYDSSDETQQHSACFDSGFTGSHLSSIGKPEKKSIIQEIIDFIMG